MRVYLKSEHPLRLTALSALWRQLAANGQLPKIAPDWTDEQREAWIERVIDQAVPYCAQAQTAMWQQEVQALRELAAEAVVGVEWQLAPLIVPDGLPVSQYALLAGFTIREEASVDEWLSPLALVWLKAVGAASVQWKTMRVNHVAVSGGAALLAVENEVRQQRLREVVQHGEEHVDEGMLLLQANLDDCTPEWQAYTMERLFAAGANDVSVLPVTMKKSRQGSLLQVLCYESQLDALKTILFAETTTFGVRYFPVAVHRLGRRFVTVETRYGAVAVKLGYHRGKRVQCSPEYEACAKQARDAGVPLGVVYAEAIQLALALADD